MGFHLLTVLWGDAYVRATQEILWSSLLAPENLPALANLDQCVYIVYTRPAEARKLEACPLWAELKSYLRCEIRIMDDFDPAFFSDIDPDLRYRVLGSYQANMVNEARRHGQGLVSLNADFLCSAGSLPGLQKLVKQGYRCVLVPGIRLVLESALDEINHRYRQQDGKIRITSRETVELAIRNQHPITQILHWETDCASKCPDWLLWPVGEEGFVMRSLAVHPFYTHPRHEVGAETSLDSGNYLFRAHPDPKDIYVVTDSDEMTFFSLDAVTHGDQVKPERPRRFSPSEVALFARQHLSPHHLLFSKRVVRLHSRDLSESWRAAEASSEKAMQSVRECLRWAPWLQLYRLCRDRAVFLPRTALRAALAPLALIAGLTVVLRRFRIGSLLLKLYLLVCPRSCQEESILYRCARMLLRTPHFKLSSQIAERLLDSNFAWKARLLLGEIAYWQEGDKNKARLTFEQLLRQRPPEMDKAESYLKLLQN